MDDTGRVIDALVINLGRRHRRQRSRSCATSSLAISLPLGLLFGVTGVPIQGARASGGAALLAYVADSRNQASVRVRVYSPINTSRGSRAAFRTRSS
jgi:hypothetical protein